MPHQSLERIVRENRVFNGHLKNRPRLRIQVGGRCGTHGARSTSHRGVVKEENETHAILVTEDEHRFLTMLRSYESVSLKTASRHTLLGSDLRGALSYPLFCTHV